MTPNTLETMLKWARKRLQQRKSKPLSKHATETLANAHGCKQTVVRHASAGNGIANRRTPAS